MQSLLEDLARRRLCFPVVFLDCNGREERASRLFTRKTEKRRLNKNGCLRLVEMRSFPGTFLGAAVFSREYVFETIEGANYHHCWLFLFILFLVLSLVKFSGRFSL